MAKIDKRKGVKPSAALAKKVTKLFELYTTRELSVAVGIDYHTLRKIKKREDVMAHKIAELETAIAKLNMTA